MVSGEKAGERLVSRSEIAQLTGVRRPAVTNWERRHADFPKPDRSGGRDYFRLTQLLGWLDGRPIGGRELSDGESAGASYGDRVRRLLAGERQRSVGHAAERGQDRAESSVAMLVGPLADSVRGSGSRSDYLNLIFSLVFLRAVAPEKWHAVRQAVSGARAADDANRVLRRIGVSADDEFRGRGLVPGMSGPLARLQPRSLEDLASVVRL